MSRQHPWPHAMGNIILISIIVSEISGHCQNLLDDPRRSVFFIDLKPLKTVGEAFRSLEKSLNFIHTFLYET